MTEHSFPDLTDRLDIHPSAWVSPHAYVRGTVTLGADSCVLPMAVVRGDNGVIRVGARVNIQDGAVLHADPDAFLTIGDDVTIGHGAVVHGCTLEDEVLIGIGAVVLNHAQIGRGSLIAARALVAEGMAVPPGSLVVGVPGVVRPLREELRVRIRRTAARYVYLKDLYRARDGTDRPRTGHE
jgi:carbonic anhydrase/acetyltransferase-like protein (isoleucine patch superfamily)